MNKLEEQIDISIRIGNSYDSNNITPVELTTLEYIEVIQSIH